MCTVRRSDFPCTHHRRPVLCTLVPEFAARISFVARRVRAACVCVWRVVCGVVRLCSTACLPHRPNGTSARESAVTLTSRAAPQSQDCVRARPFRVPALFASVRSARGRCGARWHVCVLASASVVAPPPRTAFVPVRGIHPRMRLAWLGRNTSRHPARPPRGACRTRAADSLWPRSSLASPRPLKAHAPSRGARLSARAPYAALRAAALCDLCG